MIVGDTAPSKYGCVSQKTVKTAAGTTYSAHAGAETTGTRGFFALELVKYSNPKLESLVRTHYQKSMKPVLGIGDCAYIHIAPAPVAGGTADVGQLVFGTKGYGAVIQVRAKPKQKVNQSALKTLAKEIVGKL